MKNSIPVKAGLYQFEFFEDKIGLCKWDAPPFSTFQWVRLEGAAWFVLVGDDIDNIKVLNFQTRDQVNSFLEELKTKKENK